MKKILLVAVLISTITLIQAQQSVQNNSSKTELSAQATQWAADRTVALNKIVNLADDQKKKIDEINLRYARRMDALNNNPQIDDKVINESRQGLFDYRINEYKTVLTIDQQEKMKQFYQQLKDDDNASAFKKAEK